jgi:hypothetical protein
LTSLVIEHHLLSKINLLFLYEDFFEALPESAVEEMFTMMEKPILESRMLENDSEDVIRKL